MIGLSKARPRSRFRDAPIRQKLVIIIMVTTAVAMFLASFGILGFDSVLFRSSLSHDLSALARIIAQNSTAAITFDDPRTATETLNALRVRTHIVSACIYKDGLPFARYIRPRAPQVCAPIDFTDETKFGSSELTVSYGIVLDGKRIGTLMMTYDQEEIFQRRQLYGGIVIGVLLLSSLIAFLLSSGLRASIEDPIVQLVKATTEVSETNDYSIRAKKVSSDELGLLADGFNEMLSGIQSRDNSLRTALFDREEALHETKKAHERFRFLAEAMPQKIFTATPEGKVDYFNQQWSEFTGLTFDQLREGEWDAILHPDDIEADHQARSHALETGEAFQIQHRFRRADGEFRWHLTRVHAMRDAKSGISMWIGSSTDIHEQKETETALRRANDDLQQFAYSASHDLQEPIRNVTIYSEIIARRYRNMLDAEGTQALGFLAEGGRRMAMLISDLLAYTRAGANDGDVSLQDASAVLKNTLAGLSEAIRESNATVSYDELPKVYMREVHLQQVLQNLIGNALKYRTDEPPNIHVSATNMGAAWRITVADNGIGIDPQYKEKIFGVFKRLHRDQKYSGTGVGLAICQRVVERYGGRIPGSTQPSATGQSSTSQSPDIRSSGDRRLNLLIVEDNLADALLVREAIRVEKLPLDVHAAVDGEVAIRFIENAEKDANAPAPDAVLLDINLPKIDGFEVLRRIRASEKFKSLPVIILTSSDSPADLSESSRLANGYFRKRPDYDEFLKIGPAIRELLMNHGLMT